LIHAPPTTTKAIDTYAYTFPYNAHNKREGRAGGRAGGVQKLFKLRKALGLG